MVVRLMGPDNGRLAENTARLRRRVAEAAQRAGRDPASITLVAVTKYVDAAWANALADLGCLDLGESRPQELWTKAAAAGERPIRWHLIGHLQRNKVRRTLPHVWLVHSVDSLRLMRELDAESSLLPRRTPILLEVNVSGDKTKHGFQIEEMPEVLRAAVRFPQLDIRGLMGMASLEGDLDAARLDFRRLRELRDRLRDAAIEPGLALPELSMGMSGDFEAAIEEGATIVRVGSAFFEGLEP